MYQTVKLPGIFGGAYQSRSRSLSSQKCINLYPEITSSGKSQTALNSFPGLKAFSTSNPGASDRGMHVMNGTLYKVGGDKLYSINKLGAVTQLGSGITSSQRCIFSDDGTNLVITNGHKAYIYNGSALTEITDTDLERPTSVAYLNNQFIFDGDGGRFVTSDIGSPSSINGLNYATAESNPDNLVRVYTFNQNLYLFGDHTIEPWYNSGVGSPPFDRVENGIIQVGLLSPWAVSNTDSFIYFLGDDKLVYRMSGYQAQSITPPGIANILDTTNDLSNSYAGIMTVQGQNMFKLTLPAINKTLVYSESTSEWFELTSGTSGDIHKSGSIIKAYERTLAADNATGDIYQFDLDTHTDNGVTSVRQRDTATISGELIGKPGGRFMMSRFELIMETGVGLNNNACDNPDLVFQYSIDGGKSFSNEDWVKAGTLGQTVKVEWYKMIAFTELIVRVKCSDPVFISIHSAAIDVQEAGY